MNYVFKSMPRRERLKSSILSNVPCIGISTQDESTFFNYIKNMFHEVPERNDDTIILRWTWPSGLQYHTRYGTYRITMPDSPTPEINEVTAMAMIRNLTADLGSKVQLDKTPFNKDDQSFSSSSILTTYKNGSRVKTKDPLGKDKHFSILVLPDFHLLWSQPVILRSLKETIIALEDTYNKIIFTIPPGTEVPTEIRTMVYVDKFDSPDIDEFESLIFFWLCDQAEIAIEEERNEKFMELGFHTDTIEEKESSQIEIFLDPDDCDNKDESGKTCWNKESVAKAITNLAQALTGLTWSEAFHTLVMSYQMSGFLSVKDVQNSKITYLNSHPALHVEDPDKLPSYEDVGGYAAAKEYLARHMSMFSPVNKQRVKELGIQPYKGSLFLGIPGTGKSLIAKAMGKESGMLVCQLDIGKVMDKFVGGSEQNMAMLIEVLEKAAGDYGIVVILDEIEKQLAGSANAGASDAGATSRVQRAFLTWLQDSTKPVIKVFTANNIDQVPPEFMRMGRVDSIFFFDLPGPEARKAILEVHLNRYKSIPKDVNIEYIASEHLENFTGAEIEQLVKECMTSILHKETDVINDELILRMIPTIKLQADTHSAQITAIRNRAKEFKPADEEPAIISSTLATERTPALRRTREVDEEVDLGL